MPSSSLILSSEQVQSLVRSKQFQFDEAAAHINTLPVLLKGASSTVHVSAETLRHSFIRKEGLALRIASDTTYKCTITAHKKRCDDAFLRAATAMSGGIDLNLHSEEEQQGADSTYSYISDAAADGAAAPTTCNEQNDSFLAEQRHRLKRRFDPDSEDRSGDFVDLAPTTNEDGGTSMLPQSPDEIQRMPRVVFVDNASAAEIDSAIKELELEEEDGQGDGIDTTRTWIAKYAGDGTSP